jgi:hypothetical protein
MVPFSDAQIFAIRTAAKGLPPEKRSLYLQRVNAFVEQRHGNRFTDSDVDTAVKIALSGLVQRTDPAA